MNDGIYPTIQSYKLVTKFINSTKKEDKNWKDELFLEHAINKCKGVKNGFLAPLNNLSLFELMMLLDNFED